MHYARRTNLPRPAADMAEAEDAYHIKLEAHTMLADRAAEQTEKIEQQFRTNGQADIGKPNDCSFHHCLSKADLCVAKPEAKTTTNTAFFLTTIELQSTFHSSLSIQRDLISRLQPPLSKGPKRYDKPTIIGREKFNRCRPRRRSHLQQLNQATQDTTQDPSSIE